MTGHTCPHIGCLRPIHHNGNCGPRTLTDTINQQFDRITANITHVPDNHPWAAPSRLDLADGVGHHWTEGTRT